MSGIGLTKVDATGRTRSVRKANDAMKIKGQFIPRGAAMLASPAFRVLSLSAHRILARVELEHMGHGGADNGSLPVTFQNFADYGIDRHAIGPAIKECVALGFLKITEEGRSGNGEFRRANRFRVTYLPTRGVAPTHDWQRIETDEDAGRIARAARSPRSVPPYSRSSGEDASSYIIESGGYSPPETTPRSGGFSPPKLIATGGKTPTGGRRKPPLGSEFSVTGSPVQRTPWATPRLAPIDATSRAVGAQ